MRGVHIHGHLSGPCLASLPCHTARDLLCGTVTGRRSDVHREALTFFEHVTVYQRLSHRFLVCEFSRDAGTQGGSQQFRKVCVIGSQSQLPLHRTVKTSLNSVAHHCVAVDSESLKKPPPLTLGWQSSWKALVGNDGCAPGGGLEVCISAYPRVVIYRMVVVLSMWAIIQSGLDNVL